jgi:hypothetical protein
MAKAKENEIRKIALIALFMDNPGMCSMEPYRGTSIEDRVSGMTK